MPAIANGDNRMATNANEPTSNIFARSSISSRIIVGQVTLILCAYSVTGRVGALILSLDSERAYNNNVIKLKSILSKKRSKIQSLIASSSWADFSIDFQKLTKITFATFRNVIEIY